jgi:hypothetical protein
LFNKYTKRPRYSRDDYEQRVLRKFFLDFAALNGLSREAAKAQDVLRKLEQAGMGGNRDHYFHSFQNFFLGLWAMGEAWDYFEKWLHISKLHWNISFEFAWFLVCMWHDVGYSVKSFRRIEEDVFGIDIEKTAYEPQYAYISSAPVVEGKRVIASLMEHLLESQPTTGWMEPPQHGQRTNMEQKLEIAIDADLKEGHGAASALRLYTDMKSFIDKCAVQRKRNMLTQATQLAAVSIPFHDWYFRKSVRENCGNCVIPALTMPFAALLTFIDSIQEDRRIFEDIKRDKAFLRELIVEKGRMISAKVDGQALAKEDIIWKIVDATDVVASLKTTAESFDVKYPKWLMA